MPSANKIALPRDPAPADPAGASAAASADPAGSSAAAAADHSSEDERVLAWADSPAWKARPAPPADVAAAAAEAALAAAKAASHPAVGAAPSVQVARRESRLTNRHRFLLQGSDYIQCAYKIAAAGLTHVGGVMRVAFKL